MLVFSCAVADILYSHIPQQVYGSWYIWIHLSLVYMNTTVVRFGDNYQCKRSSNPIVTHQPVEDGLVDNGGHDDERDRRQELHAAVHRGPVRPVEHLLKGLPPVSSEGWHRSHHRKKRAPFFRTRNGGGRRIAQTRAWGGEWLRRDH